MIHAGETVTIKQDPKRRSFRVSGVVSMAKDVYVTLTLKSWNQLWVSRVPFSDVEVIENDVVEKTKENNE